MNVISTNPVIYDHRMMMARAMAGNQDACRRLFGAQPNLIQQAQAEQTQQIDAAIILINVNQEPEKDQLHLKKQPVASKPSAKSKQKSGKVVAKTTANMSDEDFDVRMLAVTNRQKLTAMEAMLMKHSIVHEHDPLFTASIDELLARASTVALNRIETSAFARGGYALKLAGKLSHDMQELMRIQYEHFGNAYLTPDFVSEYMNAI